MAVTIRLRREGSINHPYYKVVVADKRSPRDGKFIEIVGNYDPKKTGHNSALKLDRIDHWLSCGAQPSDTVRSLIKKNRKAASGEAVEEAPAEKPTAKKEPAQDAPKETVEAAASAPAAEEAPAAPPTEEPTSPAAEETPASA